MRVEFRKSQIAFAVATVLSAATMTAASAKDAPFHAPSKSKGTYATGDFHNHTTCSDGSISMQKLVKKSIDKKDTPWGLDWFVQAGHGGSGNRNCTLVEDATLSTPAYPYVEGQQGPQTTWANTIGAANVKGNTSSADGSSTTPLSSLPNPSMWRWQSVQEYQYPITEYLSAVRNMPVFMGLESVVAGHEHTSMSVITGQIASSKLKGEVTPAGYAPAGDATALAMWSYCFDRNDTDNSRGGGQNWDCSVPGSLNAADPSWRATAAKLMPAGGPGNGERGHAKTVEAMKWMAAFHPTTSYYVPAHLERAGPFNPDGNNGFNVEHLRNFNNAAPAVAFGFETQPGHGASDARGEYRQDRNTIGGVRVDSVGGTTYGGTGIYGAQIGGVWDALLGEGRNWWFFASSDWHNRGAFGPDDRRTTQDFLPGEYQRDYVMVRDGDGKGGHDWDWSKRRGKGGKGDDMLTPQEIVDGLRTGNSWTDSGQLIDRLAFVACADTRLNDRVGNALLEAAVLKAAMENTDVEVKGAECAGMGEKLKVRQGQEVVVAIAVRDPQGTSYSPYTFANPSLAQIGINQPLNAPVLDHIDVIRGLVTGYKKPGSADYAGTWPDNWIEDPNMDRVPAAAKNPTAAVLRTFDNAKWKSAPGHSEKMRGFKTMVFRIPAVKDSQYLRLRGTNLPPAVPYETDADGNPLPDVYTNAVTPDQLKIACTVNPSFTIPAGETYAGNKIDGCPDHMERIPAITGQKYVSYDVAAWADLWFYSNPIFIEVKGGTLVAGVK
jgi:hypothetical protein